MCYNRTVWGYHVKGHSCCSCRISDNRNWGTLFKVSQHCCKHFKVQTLHITLLFAICFHLFHIMNVSPVLSSLFIWGFCVTNSRIPTAERLHAGWRKTKQRRLWCSLRSLEKSQFVKFQALNVTRTSTMKCFHASSKPNNAVIKIKVALKLHKV
jgi:hypothetical protein